MTNEADKPSVEGLKPCPFCGGSDVVTYQDNPVALRWLCVVCDDCGASSMKSAHMDRAIAAWNRRASAAAPAAQPATPLREVLSDADRKLMEQALAALGEVEYLIGESQGVYGLHLNGDVSPWGELIEGGRFERLTSLDCAIAALRSRLDGEKT